MTRSNFNASPYCLCGAAAPYDHNLGCPHALRPTPEQVGCAVCAREPITADGLAAFQAGMREDAERTLLDVVDRARTATP